MMYSYSQEVVQVQHVAAVLETPEKPGGDGKVYC